MTPGTKPGALESAEAISAEGVGCATSAVRSAAPGSASTGKSALLDQAYEAFVHRTEAGERLDPEAYCAQFPALQSSLPRLLQLHRYLEDKWANSLHDQDVHWPAPGEAFLDYQLILELGKGAFARVFLATEPKLGNRLVAVKIARQGGAAEAQTLGRLQHPNIAPVYSVTEDRAAGFTLVCMPYMGSATLHDVLDRVKAQPALPSRAQVFLDAASDLTHPLESDAVLPPPAVTLQTGTYLDGVRWLGAQLAQALAFIHGRGVCHLDLKPSNVLLTPNGTPMLLDFNLSADSHRDHHRLGGTFPYMSPEQLRACDRHALPAAIAAVGASSDLYSLGVLLYCLVTGVHPFGPIPLKSPEEELRSLILERQRAGFRPVRQVNPEIDLAFADLIERCLASDPARRPKFAAAVASVLRRDLRPAARARRWLVHHPKKTLAGALLAALLVFAALAVGALTPSASERHYSAGQANYRAGDFKSALENLSQAVEADPISAKAYFARGRALQKLGAADRAQYSRAMEDFQKAHELAPAGKNLAAVGYCFHLLGFKGAALLKYREAENNQAFVNAELLNNIGVCLMQTGEIEEARAYLTKAIEADPRLAVAYLNRATLLTNLAHNRAEELDHLAKNPGGIPALAGTLKKRQQELADALNMGQRDIEKLLDLGPADSELSYRAACYYAVAAKVEPPCKKDALRHLANAVASPGFDPTQLKANRHLTTLADEPQFQAWTTLPAPTRAAAPPVCFVDPIHDSAP